MLTRNKKKGNLDGCVHEVELYIKSITERFGSFEYAQTKINYDPKKEEEQIKILYPRVSFSNAKWFFYRNPFGENKVDGQTCQSLSKLLDARVEHILLHTSER